MSILDHFDKNNLHHAYLIEGSKDEVTREVLKFLKSLDIKTTSNPDFVQINTDSFKIDDARNLKAYAAEKGHTTTPKVFIVSANNFLLEAQNSLLKLFEEPIENTYFFIITPDASIFLKTLFSRFYFISTKQELIEEKKVAEKFISMPAKNRLEFIKELLTVEEEDEEGDEAVRTESARSKALKFLNALESTLHSSMSKGVLDTSVFEHIFKVRKFLSQPGSSTKTLMESVALVTPSFKD